MATKKTAEELLEEVEEVREVFRNLERLARESRLDMKKSGLLDTYWTGRYTAREAAYKLAAEQLEEILEGAAG